METYKGFKIIPRVHFDGVYREGMKWRASAIIQRAGREGPARDYWAKGSFAYSEKEAMRLGMEYGKKVVDGAIPDASVTDL